MGVAADLTDAYREVFDAKREVFWEGATLTLILNAGTEDEEELEVEGGWFAEKQRRFGEVESMYLIQITARESLTTEVMSQADRLRLKGVLYRFNFDPPGEAPELWQLYATEMKAGGLS